MLRRWTATVVLCGLLLVGADAASAGEHSPAELRAAAGDAGTVNGLCPVLSRPVTRAGGSMEYRGERIGFCCPQCAAKFRADPVRYMNLMRRDPAKHGYESSEPGLAEMTRAARAAGSANGLCPIMGNLVTPTGGAVQYRGQKIAFCCKGCIGKFEADPEAAMRAMRADPLAYAYDRPGPTHEELRTAREAAGSVNGLCPVMGKLVKASGGSVEYRGEKIAFCCPGCIAKFQASPETYMQKLRAEPALYGYIPEPAAAPGTDPGR